MIASDFLEGVCTFVISALSIPGISYGNDIDYLKLAFTTFILLIDSMMIFGMSMHNKKVVRFVHHIASLSLIYKVTATNQSCLPYINDFLFLESSAFLLLLTKGLTNKIKLLSKIYWTFDRLIRLPMAILLSNEMCYQSHIMEVSIIMYVSAYWTFEMFEMRYINVLAALFTYLIMNDCEMSILGYVVFVLS